jgi:hypothetical protein
MEMRTLPLRIAVSLVTTTALAMIAFNAGAATRSMIGSITVENPSNGFELSPGVYGRKVGGAGANTYPPTAGALTVDAVGAGTAATTVGNSIAVGAGKLNRTGFQFQDFPAFANVGQVSKNFQTIQGAATFAAGNGALAACPGPGCTASGAGTAISWCPPTTHNTAAPAPGNATAPIGNWDCPSWQAGAGGGDRFLRMAITNVPGAQNYGGTLSLLRNHSMNVWRVPAAPSTVNASDAEVTRSFMDITNLPWSGGQENFAFTNLGGNNGPLLLAKLNARGAIEATFGCQNGIGDQGGAFNPGNPIVNLGTNCGTNVATPNVPGQGWGFKMTTGTISGSDPYPFGVNVTTVAGTPFNPTFNAVPVSIQPGFLFSRKGADELTTGPSSNRNLVMLGGGIAVDPSSGNAFFRITELRMNLSVPEPATGLGLLAGAGALLALARRRLNV